MKIKKKELRKGLAQLPINYPAPSVLPDSLPGGVLDMDVEMVQVELICKQLAHNEVAVRDAALGEVPRYLEKLTQTLAEMESDFAAEMAIVAAYFKAHPRSRNPYRYDNIPLALFEFRRKAQEDERRARRRASVRELKRDRAERKREQANQGRYGGVAIPAAAGEEEESSDEDRNVGASDEDEEARVNRNVHRARYAEWMQTWCDAELIFLKLARGLHFCLWHSDKPLVQLACAQRIADLIAFPATTRCKVLFYGSLYRVLAREWPTIDRYRMDKYLALVRRMTLSWVLLVKKLAETTPVEEEEAVAEEEEVGVVEKKGKAAPPAKKGKKAAAAAAAASPKKRSRSAAKKEEDDDDGDDEEKAAAASSSFSGHADPNATTAKGIPDRYVTLHYGRQPAVQEALREMFYILQVQIIPTSTSVGLTMHLCDVAFDELTKAFLPVPLFVTLAAGIPLYAMSQGNYVEKRVLDTFFPPLAGGYFAQRRAAQILDALRRNQRRGGKGSVSASKTPEELDSDAQRMANADTDAVLGEVAHTCQLFSVSRGTARSVRVMFSEAELVLRQSRDPDAFTTLTKTTERRRIEREIEEVNETRAAVRDARAMKREGKKAEVQSAIKEEVKARKEAMVKARKGKDESEIDEKALRREVAAEEREKRSGKKKTKPATRDTKRKKGYKLTKEDLYGDGDSEEEK